jgi:serine/threonine-protein kinase HipA
VVRLHQEDMCQAVGLRPVEKYAIGRPSERMARLLREFADDPRTQVERLFRQLAFRVVTGDEDGHGKNYSVLLSGGAATLAPLYDSLCTLFYPELSGTMATRVGTQESLAGVDRTALAEEAAAMGIPRSEAAECLDRLGEELRQGIGGLEDGVTSGWPSERVAEIISTRIERLESGQPLGLPEGRRARRRRTFDEATLRTSPGPVAEADWRR